MVNDMNFQNLKYPFMLLFLWCVGFVYLALMTSDMTSFIVRLCILTGFIIFAVWVSKIVSKLNNNKLIYEES